MCLDRGYDNPSGRAAAEQADYQEHIKRIGEEKIDEVGEKTHPARRWVHRYVNAVVERTFGWLSRCRGLLIRWDKKASNYLANMKLACALLWFRRAHKAQQQAEQANA